MSVILSYESMETGVVLIGPTVRRSLLAITCSVAEISRGGQSIASTVPVASMTKHVPAPMDALLVLTVGWRWRLG